MYILINWYTNNFHYIDSYMLTNWKHSNYGQCKFNYDTNLVLIGVNINNSHWCLLVADYIKKMYNR